MLCAVRVRHVVVLRTFSRQRHFMKILMLDLEGVLVLTAESGMKRVYADEFLRACKKLFDKMYLNTAVPEKEARHVMKEKFGVSRIGYWKWGEYKTEGYEQFVKDTVVHVEDGAERYEVEQMHDLGVHYVGINPNWDLDAGELKKALEKIKNILGK